MNRRRIRIFIRSRAGEFAHFAATSVPLGARTGAGRSRSRGRLARYTASDRYLRGVGSIAGRPIATKDSNVGTSPAAKPRSGTVLLGLIRTKQCEHQYRM
jgi:hypothetical protein